MNKEQIAEAITGELLCGGQFITRHHIARAADEVWSLVEQAPTVKWADGTFLMFHDQQYPNVIYNTVEGQPSPGTYALVRLEQV
jgi:hypothetical protein